MMLLHKVLDCVQVAIGTGQREQSVTSLVDCTYNYTCTSVVLNDEQLMCHNDDAYFQDHNDARSRST